MTPSGADLRDRMFRALRRIRGRPGIDPLAEALYLQTMAPDDRRIVDESLPYTITGVPRLLALIEAVRYCVRAGVPGDLAECGVWRGGSVLAMILTLQERGVTDRDVYLYDLFGRIPASGEPDRSSIDDGLGGWIRRRRLRRTLPLPTEDLWASEAAVRETVGSAAYPEDRVHFVAGRVEDTIPDRAPERLALLRLAPTGTSRRFTSSSTSIPACPRAAS